MRHMTDEQRRVRLAGRHALARRVASVESATEAVVCLHATEPASVYLSAAARCGVAREDVDLALYIHRSVVRQLAMRRTIFAFPRALLPAAWGSAGARVAAQQQVRLAKDVEANGIALSGTAWVTRVCNAVLASLRQEGPATTAELRGRIPALDSRIVISPEKAYGGDFPIAPRVLATVAASGDVVRGDNRGDWRVPRPVWWATEQWLGEPVERLSAERGYAELVGRWLERFGPGTEDDIVWWLGATRSAVRQALAAVGAVQVELETGTGHVLPNDLDDDPAPEPWAALLPAMDPTVMGWKNRDFYLGPHGRHIFDANGNGGPTAWWDGRIVGGWRQDDRGVVSPVLLEDIGGDGAAALEAQAQRLTAWLGGDVVSSLYQSPLVRRGGSTA